MRKERSSIIRPKARRFVVLRVLLDWQAQEPGTYNLIWDGRDSKGNFVASGLCTATVETQPLRGYLFAHRTRRSFWTAGTQDRGDRYLDQVYSDPWVASLTK